MFPTLAMIERIAQYLQIDLNNLPLSLYIGLPTNRVESKEVACNQRYVSRALKNSHQISEATIQKVKEYAEKHNYKPNLAAQALKSKQSHCIGVVLSNIPNNFF